VRYQRIIAALLQSRSIIFGLVLVAIGASHLALAQTSASDATHRERISIDSGWRFQKGDPEGHSAKLLYDVRPEVKENNDAKAADARPEDVQRVRSADQALLKSWILPTGNAFIKDPARRYVRPPGHPGSDVPYVQASFDDSAWRVVTLPHDWAIEGPFLVSGPYGGMGRLPSWGVGWYRKKLDIPASDAGRSIFLDVDGAMSYATVWLNGKLLGGWPYGYNSWRLDLTPHVVPGGVNQLAIRLDNPEASSRWYPGAGLYRSVWLTKTHPVHVSQWGTRIKTPQISRDAATVELEVSLDNDSTENAQLEVMSEVFALDASGKRAGRAVAKMAPVRTEVPASRSTSIKTSGTLKHPRLWGPPPQQPNRYVAVTSILSAGKLIDRYETPFGIRSLRFDANNGLFVNGERVVIKGVNNHHDLGALGAAFNVRAAERQLEILRDMGANAIRMSHNPPAPELLELTDRMGFLVIDEIFDMWLSKKTPLDAHLIFPEWHEQDLRAMLRRDRNHPSIMLWSVGNEVGEQYTGEQGAMVAKELVSIVREEDDSRPTMTAMNYAKSDMPLPATVDVITLNYQGEGIRDTPEFEGTDRIRTPPQYPAFHARFPDKMILSSETASALSSRGVYLFPVDKQNSSPIREGRGGDSSINQVSAYELYAVDFGSSADKVFAALDRHPYVAGEFVWTGWDYLGEPTPYYSSRSSYSGIIDLAGFKKDRFYLYQARWRPDVPLVHILPHWTWPERVGQITPVHVFTSGDEAELFVNGKSQGRKKKAAFEYRLRWDEVTYEPGELRVVAYKDGKQWATASTVTADAAQRLELTADRNSIRADGRDLSFITVRIADAKGTTAPRADNRIRFSVEGPGTLLATDNGDPTSFESFQSSSRKAFNGLGLVIVRSEAGKTGTITVRAESESLEPATVTVRSKGN
jgi:beta-galactosidase